jgi:hypothetical protein
MDRPTMVELEWVLATNVSSVLFVWPVVFLSWGINASQAAPMVKIANSEFKVSAS